METTTVSSAKFLRILGGFIITMIFSTHAHAQTGIVSGRVLDEEAGLYLRGAIVRIEGTDQRTETDIQGNFVFQRVPEGDYTISAAYIGVGEGKTTVSVKSNDVARISIPVGRKIIDLEAFTVVAGTFETGNQAAINQQRTESGIVNVVNEDQFTQMDDGNIGFALRRMPGLSVDTDGSTEQIRYVNIRGFDGSLNAVALDGNRLPSTETGAPSQRGGGTAYSGAARNFALDDAPASAITNVEIIKAPTPDMDGDALGGTVNLITRSAFQRDGRSFDFQIGGSYAELRDSYGLNGSMTYQDLYSVGGGERNFGVSVTLAYFDQEEGFDNRDYDYVYLSQSGDAIDTSAIRPYDGSVNDYLHNLPADRERTGQAAIGFNEDTEHNNYNIDRERYQFSASLDYKLSKNTELYFKPTLTQEKRTSTDLRHHLIMDSSDCSSLNHGDKASPLEQYVSFYRADDPSYDSGNYFDFIDLAEAAGMEDDEFSPGDSLTWDGTTMVFDPGALVRLGDDPNRISTIHPDNSDSYNMTTWNPDGSARGQVRYEGDFETLDLQLWNMNFGGKTYMDWGVVDYNAYYARTTNKYEEWEQEWKRDGFQFMVDRTVSGSPYETEWVLLNADQVSRDETNPTGVDKFIDTDLEYKKYKNEQDMYGFQVNAEWELPNTLEFTGSIKTGVKFRGLKFDYDYDEAEWDLLSGFPFGEDWLYMNDYEPVFGNNNFRVPYVPDAPRIYREALPAHPEWFSEQYSANVQDSVKNDYTAQEDTWATYLMTTVETGNLQIIAGFRYEYTDFNTDGFINGVADGVDTSAIDPFTMNEEDVAEGTYSDGQNYEVFLPSIHLRYDFTDKLVARASWGKTYAKPAVKDMVGTEYLDTEEEPYTMDVPNVNLPYQGSENFDISIEYYTTEGGYYQLAFFYKDMENYAWEETYTTNTYPGYEGYDVVISTPIANTDAVNYGWETAINQPLSSFADFLDGFSINATATYTESNARYYTGRTGPTVGHSYIFYNVSLAYEKFGFFGRVSWLYRSKFFENISISDFAEESEAIAPNYQFLWDDYFDNPGQLDAELGYRINDNYSIYLNVTNITEGINASRQGYYQYPEDSYPHRRRWTFGIKGHF